MSNWKRSVIISDMHIPGHDKVLFEKFIDFIEDYKPNRFVINGDFMDMFSLSKFAENNFGKLKLIDLTTEYQYANDVLDQIENALPKSCVKEYLKGNHELRIETFMMKGDNIKFGRELTDLYSGLNLFKRKIKLYEDYTNDVCKLANDLFVTHDIGLGLYYGQTYLRKSDGHSVICGHTHRPSTSNVGSRIAIGAGHMADNDSPFMAYATRLMKQQWRQGFVTVQVNEKTGSWVYENIIVNDNHDFIADGNIY